MTKNIYIILLSVVFLFSCGHPSVPQGAKEQGKLPTIYPDYTEVTIPANLCPPNFMMETPCDEVVAQFSVGNIEYCYSEENKVIIDEGEWAEMRDAAKGKSISVKVYAKSNGEWTAYKPFSINVAKEDIDPYLSYRLIEPSYVIYNDLSIEQRDITSFDASDIYNNQLYNTPDKQQCINCHSYQDYKTSNMLFHVRQNNGGTVIVHDGAVEKVDLKRDSTISAGVYPAWHPKESLIAFSTNTTQQSFHTKDNDKIEVFDTASDLILYDVENHKVSTISQEKDELECFPTWSPDGKTLYYTSAHFEYVSDTLDEQVEFVMRYKEVKYNIYSRSFDAKSRTFGPAELVFDAAAIDKSATLPRISPDGKYLTFSLGNYGCFHVWHNDADIMVMDLKTKEVVAADGLNSNFSESYPSFSSNGRWLMCASRCDDGNHTRPRIAYFDKNGKCGKAFLLPQSDPERYKCMWKSFNRPEFMVEPVKISPQQFAEKIKE